MKKIINFYDLKKTVHYFTSIKRELKEEFGTEPYSRLHDCQEARLIIEGDKRISKDDKNRMISVIDYLGNLAQEKFNERGYGL